MYGIDLFKIVALRVYRLKKKIWYWIMATFLFDQWLLIIHLFAKYKTNY